LTHRARRLAPLAVVVLVAGCGSGESPRPAARNASVEIADFKYRPARLEVARGARVTWRNRDSSPHTATAPGVLDTGILRRGEQRTLRLTRSGTHTYVCELHPFMKASIVVRGEEGGS
jgi:plastocyanin